MIMPVRPTGRHPRTLPRTLATLTTLVGYTATTTHCPSCGQPLKTVEVAARTPQQAPWLCTEERLMFWNVELHPAARACYHAHRRDWGATAQWLRTAVARERGSRG